MPPIGSRPVEQPSYPALLLRCPRCELVQLGLIVDPRILFPPEYPYTSGTTKILRENFAELYREARALLALRPGDLVVDIGSNDGTLLRNFKDGGHRVRGVEPTDQGRRAEESGVPTDVRFFDRSAAADVVMREGQARVVTAANVFAHIDDIHEVIAGILDLLRDDGVFISESHYWLSLVERLQYDTIYHEHLRYYSLTSMANLLRPHDLEVFHAKLIPTHGGSLRVYASRKGRQAIRSSIADILEVERRELTPAKLDEFRDGVSRSKLELYALLRDVRARGDRIYGIGAPSRSSTLINYLGLDDMIVDCVLEVRASHKIGKYVPGTLIPVLDEQRLVDDQPAYALLFSWHLADELIPKLRTKGFRGRFIVPLPRPRVVDLSDSMGFPVTSQTDAGHSPKGRP